MIIALFNVVSVKPEQQVAKAYKVEIGLSIYLSVSIYVSITVCLSTISCIITELEAHQTGIICLPTYLLARINNKQRPD